MRLKAIKLAGFKSFVDPTTVPFPSNMTAIVGPNGCGKSNIIDAVRWVLGESSAKHLRGESMADVIFNGSTSRKPVSQASIELIFDNTEADGKLTGEYAAFNEIAIKRRVTRDGTSDYFLNGTRCRRRDITDIFLGTGLGPRSYAIIEQGMISRLIEARPEDLRVYIEEAAGISKYKERRKETESRMKRTQENLERLKDIRDELERQLQHLHKQAQAAEKYREYKAEERQRKAQLAGMRWRRLETESSRLRATATETEVSLERMLLGRTGFDTRMETLRETQSERQEEFNRAQGRFYDTGSRIARMEQSMQHQQEMSRRYRREIDESMAALSELAAEQQRDQDVLASAGEQILELDPQLAELLGRADESAAELQTLEERMQHWQGAWDQFNGDSANSRQEAEVQQARIQSIEQNQRRLTDRRERLGDELELLREQLDSDELASQRLSLAEAEESLHALQSRQASLHEHVLRDREQIAVIEKQLAEKRGELQRAQGQLASQQALLDELLGQSDEALTQWLSAAGLASHARVAQSLTVENGWETAVEAVLGRMTQGVVVTSSAVFSRDVSAMPAAGLCLVAASMVSGAATTSTHTLSAMVQGEAGVCALLGGVLVAETLAEGLSRQPQLQAHESLITRDGVWIGPSWIRFPDRREGQSGVLAKQRLVSELGSSVSRLTEQTEILAQSLTELREALRDRDSEREQLRQTASQKEREAAMARSRCSALEARQEQLRERVGRLDEEREENTLQSEELAEQLLEVRTQWQDALERLDHQTGARERLMAERDDLRATLDQKRQSARYDRDQTHQIQLELHTLRGREGSLRQAIERLQAQRDRLNERLETLRASLEEAETPADDLRLELEGLLELRLDQERRLQEARTQLEEVDQQQRQIEQERHRIDQDIQTVRSRLEKARLELQALDIHMQAQREQLAELEADLIEVIQALPDDADEAAWEEEMQRIANRIQRLGAINLAAIDEYRLQGERKTYLDEQHNDLTEALATLEEAIRKIDRETRQRFKDTFDKINASLQELFPKVFGGGQAYLELTGDDLLDTGVAIMARPPGKKNSTIHLLSGGEKALTAIALVFSIFRLNPAPFCMLDEVDAPLDDANVGRYANIVKEMSGQVQFIYISHNKIAMEQADHLMGVTMHEPGCSRLVSVNVEEAAALAAL